MRDPTPIPEPTREERRRQLAEVRRRIAGGGPGAADRTMFQRRVLAACDELETRLAGGSGGGLGAEVLWTLVSLAPAILEPPRRTDLAPRLYPHPELLEGRETAQRLRAAVAAFAPEGPAARWCRLLSLMLETVEHLTCFRHPGGSTEVVGECFEVLGAGAAFLESTAEGRS